MMVRSGKEPQMTASCRHVYGGSARLRLAAGGATATIYAGDRPLLTTRVTVAPLASRILSLSRCSRTVVDGRSDVFRITAPSEQ